MKDFGAFDGIARSSSAFRIGERFDQESEIALAGSLTGRMLDAFARLLAGSAIARYLKRETAYRSILSSSFVARLLTALFEALHRPVARVASLIDGSFTGWRRIWAGSRVSDYWRYLYRFETGVVFLALFIPVELYLFQFLPRTVKYLVELGLFVMTGVLFLSALAGRRRFFWTELELPVSAFAVVALLSAVVNGVPLIITIAGIRALLQFYLLYFIVVQASFDRVWLKRLVLGLLGFAVLLALFGLTQKLTGVKTPIMVDIRETTIKGRIISTFANPNNFGGFLLLMLPGAIALFVTRVKAGLRFFAGFAVLAMLPALIFTYSRGAWIGFGAALVILSILLDRRILVGLALAVVALFVLVPNVIDRLAFALSTSYIKTSIEAGRLFYWQKALDIMMTNPLLGVGPGRFGGAVAAVFGAPANALIGLAPNYKLWVDSQIFQVIAELGMLGLAVFFWVPLTFVKNAIAFMKREEDPFWRAYAAGAIASITGILIQGVVVGVWETHQISAFFWLTMAIVMSLAIRVSSGVDA